MTDSRHDNVWYHTVHNQQAQIDKLKKENFFLRKSLEDKVSTINDLRNIIDRYERMNILNSK